MTVQLFNDDFFNVLPNIDDESIDLILCDLPYGGFSDQKWDVHLNLDALWKEYSRIIRPKGIIALNCAQPFTSKLIMSNIKDFRYCWYWKKNRMTNHGNARRMPMRCIEEIAVFYKEGFGTYNAQGVQRMSHPREKPVESDDEKFYTGTSLCNPNYVHEFTGWPNQILEFGCVGRTVHPTQKPVELCDYFVKTYSNPGDTVLDNCMGSGTTGVAAKNLGRTFIGIEQDKRYFEIAKERIENAHLERLEVLDNNIANFFE